MNVLFVCTGNTCRSPMAEALMKKIAADRGWDSLQCDSAGLAAFVGSPMSNEAKIALKQWGIEHFDHRSKAVSSEFLNEFDLVVTVTEHHRLYLCQKFSFQKTVVSLPTDVGDPYGGNVALYEETARQIVSGLEKLIGEGVIHD